MKSRSLFFLLILWVISLNLVAQEIYWESPRILISDNAGFPQVAVNEEIILLVWQEYNGQSRKVSLKSSYSSDGKNWSEPEMIIGPFDFFMEEQVALFSLTYVENNAFYIAFPGEQNQFIIYRSTNGMDFQIDQTIESDDALLSPDLYDNGRGEPLLLLTQNLTGLENLAGGISIYYTQRDSDSWAPVQPLFNDDDLTLNLLPAYHQFEDREYVVFQSLFTGVRITWQLYIMYRDFDSDQWSFPEQITTFTNQEDRLPEYYSNQRPYLSDNGENLMLTWERNYTLESPQIHFAYLDREGSILEKSNQAITTGFRYNAYPRVFTYRGNEYSLWFDNRDGNQIIFSDIRFSFRGGDSLSNINGDSSYAEPVFFKDNLYLFWENRFLDRQRIVLLGPDKSVAKPRVVPIGFQPNKANREILVTFNWISPEDSSGLRRFAYSWNRDEESNPAIDSENYVFSSQPLSFQATEDGNWYFHLAAQDNAGNWSEPVHFLYNRDRTAPSSVQFIHPETDEWGYLISNSSRLSWKAPPEEDVAGYNFTLSYQGLNFPDPENFPVKVPENRITQLERAMQLRNQDNGIWVLAVVAIDNTGNVSEPSYSFFQLNKYQPVTYISWVSVNRDEMDNILLRITGRGFRADGDIIRVILDQDGVEPYDYEYYLNQDYRVSSDRLIDGPNIEFMDKGVYRIAVEHPVRGLAWGRNQLSLDSTGTVKYGDFSQSRTALWEKIKDPALRIVLNQWFLYLLLGFFLLISLVSILKSRQYLLEYRQISLNSQAILENSLFYGDIIKEEAKIMKRKGLRLRAKFTLAIVSLVISIVLIVAIFLGRYMITSQQLALGQELEKRSAMLLDTLVTGGKNYLPTTQRIELRLLPNQISAMEEATYTTILGKGYNDPDNYIYIWASNDENINQKHQLPELINNDQWERWLELLQSEPSYLKNWYEETDNGWTLKSDFTLNATELGQKLLDVGIWSDFVIGETPYFDPISDHLRELEIQINQQALDSIGELKQEAEDLSLAANRLVLQTDTQSKAELSEIQNTINMISEQINQTLQNISNNIGVNSYPDFIPENLTQLSEGEYDFIFYKPIIYSDRDNNQYYKGSVRLAITVEPLLRQLNNTRFTIYRITAITFIVAILIGLTGAILLSASMIKPIRELAQHVQIISETEDKKTLNNHIYPVKSGDEIGDLGNIINNMTHGLVEAAKANEDLMAGKEIQKAFIPLEFSRISDQKHTTGRFEDDDIKIFGYYEGAKTVSGDYFDFRQLDDEYFAIIKCDIAGKGVAASLIMVEVATIFVNYFRSHKPKEEGVDLSELVWTINDLLNEVGFKGRFAAFNILLLNKVTGQTWMCHAGDREVNIYDNSTHKMYVKMLNDVPTAGSIDSELLKLQGMGYKQTPFKMDHGDIIFLYTDGIEEAQNRFRNKDFKKIQCDGSCGSTENDPKDDDANTTNHIKGETFEEFSTVRVFDIIETCLDKGIYKMTKYHDPLGDDHVMTFDYSNSEGTEEEAVLALIAAQFVFQLIPDPSAGELERVMVDKRVDEFMKKHFVEYRNYFKYPVENQENGEYIYYTHLRKDDQTDDLTILAIRKK